MSIRHKGIYAITLKGVLGIDASWRTKAYWNGEHWRHVAHVKGDNCPRITEEEVISVGNYLGHDDNNPGETK